MCTQLIKNSSELEVRRTAVIHKYLDIPWAYQLAFWTTAFLGYEKKAVRLENTYCPLSKILKRAPPSVFQSLPLCYQRSAPCHSTCTESGSVPTLRLRQLLNGNTSSSQNENSWELFSGSTPFSVSLVGYKGWWWVSMEDCSQLISQVRLYFPAKWTSLSACSSGRESHQQTPLPGKVRASTSLRLRKGNLTPQLSCWKAKGSRKKFPS